MGAVRHRLTTLLLCLLLAAALPARAAEESADEVDFLALAALMLRDGNIDRAIVALDQVDPAAEGVDLVRYYTLRGMAHMRRNELEPARDALLQAVESGDAEAVVFVYLAQVNYQLQDYRATIDALDRAGAALERVPSAYHMKAQSYWLLEEPVMALAILDQGARVFPEDSNFIRRKVFYLVDLGLYKEAVVQGRQYLQQSAGTLEDYVALGNALRASGELDEAAAFLEEAANLLGSSALGEASRKMTDAGDQWRTFALACARIIRKREGAPDLKEAARLLRRCGEVEREAYAILKGI